MRGAGQSQRLVESLLRGRVLDDRARPPIECGDLVDQLVLGDVRQTAEDTLPLLVLGFGSQLDLIDAHQLLPLFTDPVERLEHLGDLALHIAARHQAFEGGTSFLVLGSDGQDLLVGLHRQLVALATEGLAGLVLQVGNGHCVTPVRGAGARS